LQTTLATEQGYIDTLQSYNAGTRLTALESVDSGYGTRITALEAEIDGGTP
jgi:hypothetical protein